MTNFFYGTSGLVLPITKKLFPAEFAEKSRLSYYASLYNSIEINSSFYKIPREATVAKWVTEVPRNFRFTFKLFKELTHAKGLQFDDKLVAPFMQAIAPAKKNQGCLLIQFPPSVTIDKLDKIQQLLSEVLFHNTDEWKIAVEFRHVSFYERETAELLAEFNATAVLHDIPASATPIEFIKDDTIYFRFHGPGGKYRGSYEDEFLKEQAKLIKKYLKQKKTVFGYFNNTIGEANKNLDALVSLV